LGILSQGMPQNADEADCRTHVFPLFETAQGIRADFVQESAWDKGQRPHIPRLLKLVALLAIGIGKR
jgi:hypothetical protein